MGDNLTFDKLNLAFQKLFQGAELLALQKNRYWMSDRGITLDGGAFVALLEYAAQKEAIIVGKPALEFFNLALQALNIPRNKVIMIGDDMESDIAGAERAGIKSVLVKTGKYRDQDAKTAHIKPWRVINSIAQLRLTIGDMI